MGLNFKRPAADDPEPHLFKVLEALRGAEMYAGAGFVTVELADGVSAAVLLLQLRRAQRADAALGEAMP